MTYSKSKNNKLIESIVIEDNKHFAKINKEDLFALCYKIEHDTFLAWNTYEKLNEINNEFKQHFNEDEYLLIDSRFGNYSSHDNKLVFRGLISADNRYPLMMHIGEYLPNNTIYINEKPKEGDLGFVLLFKNEQDRLLTQVTNCFGLFND